MSKYFNSESANEIRQSTVYGPVRSWRVGLSLGIDLLHLNSICSFRCVYCQLGKINVHTDVRKVYVPTETVMRDLKSSDWRRADIITLSGNGEPTLAANIGEVIREIKSFTLKPVLVLTNSAHLSDPLVRRGISAADRIFCKLDAAEDKTFRKIARPVEGITLRRIVDGIKMLRAEYAGFLAIQTMLTQINRNQLQPLATLLKEIQPDEVQLNLPLRPIPRRWSFEARGNREFSTPDLTSLKPLPRQEALLMGTILRRLTYLRIVSPYQSDQAKLPDAPYFIIH
jgi:wyosine [tRNA(Phe)-imidazoG37] synthetase (radical SAM superfamily)